MADHHTNLIARDDTMLGICQALGEDFGFNPIYLRILISVPLLWNPAISLGAYATLGVLVLFSRLVFPNPRIVPAAAAEAVLPAEAVAAPVPAPVSVPAPAQGAIDKVGRQLLPLAA